MKKTILLVSFFCLFSSLDAQNAVDRLFFDARGSFHQELRNGQYGSNLNADYFNLHIYGRIAPDLTYRVRQRLNKGIDEKNPFSATDWLCLNWSPSPRWTFTVGKTAVLIGGYEFDSAPIDVYYYSRFCTNLPQGFAISAGAQCEFHPAHRLALQVSNAPHSIGFQDKYAYSLAWKGRFAPWWNTIWSINLVEDEFHRMIGYQALGNHLVFGGLAVDVDLMNRASVRQKNLLSDYTVISKIIWSVGKWNYCAKVGYEKNAPENFDSEGRAYDRVIAPGTEYFYWGCGIEFFPLADDTLRLHLAYFSDNAERRNNLQLGITWRFDAISGNRAGGR